MLAAFGVGFAAATAPAKESPIVARHHIDEASRPAYERLRRRQTLARLRLAILVGLPFLAGAFVLNALLAPVQMRERLGAYALLGVSYLLPLGLARWRRAAVHAQALALAYVGALAGSLLHILSLSHSPTDLGVLAGPMTCVMINSTLFFPWGPAAQAMISGALTLGYGAVMWPALALSGVRGVNVLVGIAAGATLSVIGAFVLERARRAEFNERRRVRVLAAQRRQLLEVGHALRGTLDCDAIAQRLVQHALHLIAADGIVLHLLDPQAGRYRVAAVAGHDRFGELVGTVWDEAVGARVAGTVAPIEVGEGLASPLESLLAAARVPLGTRRLLLASIGPASAPTGFLAWHRSQVLAFDGGHHLVAQGIADQAYTALAAARLYEDAARASRLKSEFVSTMSHELRTPLNVIMGYSQLLGQTLPSDPETTRALDAVRRSSLELLDLVEATLDLGRLEAGRDSVREESVRLRDLFDELAREMAPVPRAGGVLLSWDAGDTTTIVVDRRKLKTVLKNLVGNALKFTPAGSVRVEARMAGVACRLRVTDTGIGIRPEDQELVFEMFRQADSSDSRRHGGTGLGLYIVRQLLRTLSGSIDLESRPGYGSTFTVTLPAAGAGQRPRPAPEAGERGSAERSTAGEKPHAADALS
jgi:signal transduction histidine kinase